MTDFTWEENKAFADIICNGLKQTDIEHLEAIADASFTDGDSDA